MVYLVTEPNGVKHTIYGEERLAEFIKRYLSTYLMGKLTVERG